METTRSRNVNELPAAERQALEEMFGQPLDPNQRVFLMASTPNAVPDKSAREAAKAGLQRTFNKVDEHAAARGVSPEEADAAMDEALQHVRPRRS